MMYHHMRDHHEHVYLGTSTAYWSTLCAEPANSVLHSGAPCDWCDDADELGAPASWWHRMWCRFVIWWLIGTPK